jgi:hypothetical protein
MTQWRPTYPEGQGRTKNPPWRERIYFRHLSPGMIIP